MLMHCYEVPVMQILELELVKMMMMMLVEYSWIVGSQVTGSPWIL